MKTNPTELLSLKDLSLKIGSHEILKNVSFAIQKGETVGLVGESGSGKSMTAKAILGFAHNAQGSILFEGENLLSKSPRELCSIRGKKIGLVCQNPMTSLNPTRSIGSQLTEGIIYHQKLSKKDAFRLAAEYLDKVGIPSPINTLDHYPDQLSGGMRQRVVIAMALINKPRLLIADEPTTSLDVTTQAQIIALLLEMRKDLDMGLLLISHDLGVVASCCDKIFILQNGQLVEQGTPEHIFYHSTHAYTRELCWKRL